MLSHLAPLCTSKSRARASTIAGTRCVTQRRANAGEVPRWRPSTWGHPIRACIKPSRPVHVNLSTTWKGGVMATTSKDEYLSILLGGDRSKLEEIECAKCKSKDVVRWEQQLRGADEMMSQFTKCKACGFTEVLH